MNMFQVWLRRLLSVEQEPNRCRGAVIELVKKLQGQSCMLDVGCGDGVGTLKYAQAMNLAPSQINGIEVKAIHLEKANCLFSVHIVDLEKDKFPYGPNTYDVVICNQVLEHLKNVFLVLGEMDRVLKIDGHLIIGIPNLSGLVNRWRVLVGRSPMCHEFPGPHCRAFAHKAFLKFLNTNNNFTIIRFTGSSFYPLPLPLFENFSQIFPDSAAYTYYLLKKIQDHQPSAWLAPLSKGMDTNF